MHFFEEGLVNIIGFRAGVEAENGGVADLWTAAKQAFPPINPIVNDAEFVRFVVKEAVD